MFLFTVLSIFTYNGCENRITKIWSAWGDAYGVTSASIAFLYKKALVGIVPSPFK